MDLIPGVEGGDGDSKRRTFRLVLDHDSTLQQIFDESSQASLPQCRQFQGDETRGQTRRGRSNDPDSRAIFQPFEQELDEFLDMALDSGGTQRLHDLQRSAQTDPEGAVVGS